MQDKLWKIYGEEPAPGESLKKQERDYTSKNYDNPETILNQYAIRVYEDTNKQFIGTVTEAISEESSEATYALYIAAPKLRDYMYRLIEVNIANLLQPYPLDVTIFAKDPKNHRTYTCENPEEFNRKLIELIQSPLTSVILMHLKQLISINREFSFVLTDKESVTTFQFDAGSTPLTIKKIILKSHIGKKPDEWGKVIAGSFLIIKLRNLVNSSTYEQPISLLQFMSLYQSQPVLELKLLIPDYSAYLANKSNSCEITLELKVSEANCE